MVKPKPVLSNLKGRELTPNSTTTLFNCILSIFHRGHPWRSLCNFRSNRRVNRNDSGDCFESLTGSLKEFTFHLKVTERLQMTDHIFFFTTYCNNLPFHRVFQLLMQGRSNSACPMYPRASK